MSAIEESDPDPIEEDCVVEIILDPFPVADLPSRYGLSKTTIYEIRMKTLGIKSFKQGTRSYITAEEVRQLDELHQFMKAGGLIGDFPGVREQSRQDDAECLGEQELTIVWASEQSLEQSPEPPGKRSGSRTGKLAKKDKAPDLELSETGSWLGQFNPLKLILNQIGKSLELMSRPKPEDMLGYFRVLAEMERDRYLPSTAELAKLLQLSPDTIRSYGEQFEDAGFVFIRTGKRKKGGAAWRVKRLPELFID